MRASTVGHEQAAAVAPGVVARLAVVAVITSVTQIALTIAFTSLAFRDELAIDLRLGLAAMFCGLLITGVVAALRSGLAGHVVGPQDSGLVVLSVVAPSIVAATSAAGETVVVLMGLSAIAVGVTMLLLGRFGLGRLVRYLPYPVLAGFLAGTGLVMGRSTIELAASGISGTATGGGDRIARLAMAIALAIAMAVIARSRLPTERTMPFLVLGSIVAFHVVRLVSGIGRTEGADRGLLLPELPSGSLVTTDTFSVAARADWGVVADQLVSMSPLLLLAPLTLLLYIGALESVLDTDLDADREFQTVGATNAVAGLLGSAPAYTQFAATLLVQRMAGRRRAIPVAIACSSVLVLAVGDPVVALVPQPVVAGMLGFIAVSFVLDWMWDLRSRVGRVELGLAVAIALSILAFDFLVGIGFGLVLAAGWFVVQYSRTSGVRSVRDAAGLRSNVSRPRGDDDVLSATGREVLVVALDGFLFFGTGDSTLRSVEQHPDVGAVRWLVIDCSRVTGADSSATASFSHLARWAGQADVELLWCGVRPTVRRALSPLLDEPRAGRVVTDLDHALELTERARIGAASRNTTAAHAAPDRAALLDRFPALRDLGARVDVATGDSVLTAGEPAPGLIVVERGRVSVRAGAPGARRRQLGPGSVLGEIGLYLDTPASSTVVADEPCTILVVDRDALAGLEHQDPAVAAALHREVASTLADRLHRANEALDALGER